MQINRLIYLIIFFIITLFSSCSDKDVNNETINILVDSDIDQGTLYKLNSLENKFNNIDINIVTNFSQNKDYFYTQYLNSKFSEDIILSKYLKNKNIINLANLSGKSYFSKDAYVNFEQNDIKGNIYIIPYNSSKKYLLINTQFYKNNNIKIPNTSIEVLQSLIYLNEIPNSVYLYNSDNMNQFNNLFNSIFSITDGLTINGYDWAVKYNNNKANINNYEFKETFNFLEKYKQLNLGMLNNSNLSIDKVINLFINDKLGLIEINTNELYKFGNIYTDKIKAFPYYSEYYKQEYILEDDQTYIAVNNNSMKNKQESIDNILKYLFAPNKTKIVINDINSIYSPLINIKTSIYNPIYINYKVTNNAKFTHYYNFEISKDYLTYALQQFLNNKITKEEFLNYWEQDVLVNKFNLNQISIAKLNEDLNIIDCASLISIAIKEKTDCDLSLTTYNAFILPFSQKDKMYSSATNSLNKGNISVEDINNLISYNINSKINNNNQQSIIKIKMEGSKLIEILTNKELKIVLCGIKYKNNKYYIIKENNIEKEIIDTEIYTIATNSNIYLPNINFENYYITNIKVKDSIISWLIDNKNITKDLIYNNILIVK